MILHAGAYFLATVYATPAVALRTGYWRLLLKLMRDEELITIPARMITTPDGDQIQAMPEDPFWAASKYRS